MTHISANISKFGGLAKGIGLPPECSCRPDAPCAKLCYARKNRFKFKNVRNNLTDNMEQYLADPVKFENDVLEACLNCKYLRWFYAGDCYDTDMFDMICDIAALTPTTRFLMFTKKFEIVNHYIDVHGMYTPNLVVVFSAWGDKFEVPNPHNLPMAYIKLKDEPCTIPAHAKLCNGSCAECIRHCNGGCWDLKPGEAVYFKQH